MGSWEDTAVYLDGRQMATTSADGWLILLDVAPGHHVVEARHVGYLTSRGAVDVVAGRVNLVGETLLLAGDAFPNGLVDVLDVATINSAFGRCVGQPLYQRWIDADGSGCVDALDVVIVNENFGRVAPTRWVPIPAP